MNKSGCKPPLLWTDEDLDFEILRVQTGIKNVVEALGLWHDCGFKSQLMHTNCEPDADEPIVMFFYSECGMDQLNFGIYENEFRDCLDELGYWSDTEDSVTLAIRCNDNELSKRFYEYFYWKWVCSLIVEDTSDVYEELFSHFAKSPEDLHKLDWRLFEILLSRIFQNHGYKSLLGPGRGDGGVDLHLWQESPLGDLLTVVQAKKYRGKIDLTPVQALFGASVVEKAQNALFVTTSSYTPAAKKFAARTSEVLILKEKHDIVNWCGKASKGVIADKSALVSRANVEKVIHLLATSPDARIVHSTWGYNATFNKYAIVVKETKHAALLLSVGNLKISDDGYGQMGTEIPMLNASTINLLNADNVIRAVRSIDISGRVGYWDGQSYYSAWDQLPNTFNYMD